MWRISVRETTSRKATISEELRTLGERRRTRAPTKIQGFRARELRFHRVNPMNRVQQTGTKDASLLHIFPPRTPSDMVNYGGGGSVSSNQYATANMLCR